MTNQEQLITPPQLVEQWIDMLSSRSDYAVFSLATQWGWDQHCAATEAELQQAADQELEACCEWFAQEGYTPNTAIRLRAARRPKPSSLKEQALEALNQADEGLNESEWQQRSETIRRALEQLND